MPTPKGHKRGCKCVVCSPATRRNTARKRRPARKARQNHGYENQALALHNRPMAVRNSTIPIGGTVRGRNATKRLGAFRKKKNPRESDPHAVNELVLYAENTSELYPMIQAVQKSLLTKMRRGTFDFLKGGKAWYNVMNRAAQLYTRDLGTPGPHGSYGMFSPADRSAAAGRMMSQFSTEAATGELDYLLPKKYQRKNPHLRLSENPAHYPRTKRGPKGNVKWFILDLYDGRGNKLSTRVRKCARAKCATESAQLVDRKVGKHMVRKVELSGPYSRKPGASTTRK